MAVSGCYEKCCTKEDAQFYGQFKWSEEMCEKLIGTKCCIQICELPNGKLFCHWTFDACPEMNCCAMFTEGQKCQVNMPHMGGKCCVTCKKTSKGYDFCVESAKCGKMEVCCEFGPEGMKRCCKKDGKTHDECWKRVIQVDGHYKCCKQVGVKEFMKKLGMSDEMIACMDDYKFCVKCCDKGIKMKECFGEMGTVCCNAKFDEECDYKFPMEGCPPCKVVFTKMGNGKFCCVAKDEAGNCCEKTYTFCGKGAKVCGRNLKTGDCCEMHFTRECCPIAGTWKTMKICGAKELLCCIGVPMDMACKIANDTCAKLVVEEKGPCVRWCVKSEVCPMDFTFKWGEEFEHCHPVLKEKVKTLCTKEGNCIMVCTKSSHGNWLMKCTVGDCFMVSKCCLEGMECMPVTTVYCREC